jgi:hypothetical protein
MMALVLKINPGSYEDTLRKITTLTKNQHILRVCDVKDFITKTGTLKLQGLLHAAEEARIVQT